jgi:hypothetical protein
MTRLLRLVLFALLLPAAVQANQVHVPEPLQGWEPWVLKDKEYLRCPMLFDRAASDREHFVCAWPGLLELLVDADGGRFEQAWTVYADAQWVALPGSTDHWPHRVTANGRAVGVVLRNGRASVYLEPGNYRLNGSFAWDERPGVLPIPRRSGLISLTVEGRSVPRPERTNRGLFLGEREQQTQSKDVIRTDVYRLVDDDVPTRLTTQLQIDVSGGVREALFGPLLPPGFVPLAIDSQLPARLEPDGKLRLQVRPGRWTVALTARAAGVLDEIEAPSAEQNLPQTEIWSYRSNDRLRVTAAEGSAPVDPAQAGVPPAWRELPAFRLRAGESLAVVERSRGIVSASNELTLDRKMWLDFDGAGFVVHDVIGGTMRADWRLDMAPPYTLLTAWEDSENLLITQGADEDETGVEVRRQAVSLETVGRVETRDAMPASGWDARFATVNALLHLPPGNKLLAAPGADRAPGSWVSQWQLLDFFLVLIITIGVWRMFGRTAGLIALLALTLSFHELNAPSWLWLNLLVAMALMRVAPPGKLRTAVRSYQLLSVAGLLLALIPFLATQVRIAIYPQLETQLGMPGYLVADLASQTAVSPDYAERSIDAVEELRLRKLPAASERLAAEAYRAGKDQPARFSRYAPNAVVQAGPGIPSWSWNTYRIGWSGPVDPEQSLRLIVLPGWIVAVLRFLEVLALLMFAAVFAAEILKRKISLPGGIELSTGAANGLLVTALLAASAGFSPVAEANTPDPALLGELEARLTEPPECAPRCAELVAANVDIRANTVSMQLTVHALADVAIPLPGSDQGWRAEAVTVAGVDTARVMRGESNALWLRLPAGRHAVSLSGAMLAVDSLEIPFPTLPRVIEASADGWFIAGIKDRRLLSGSLQLTRLEAANGEGNAQRWESSRFPAFAHIERSVELDIDWRATTIVTRVAPRQGALTLEIPLIEGESVLTEGLTVRDGKILVTMNPNQRSVSWTSNLPRTSPLSLKAGAGSPWKETWRVGVGSIWHVEFAGVPESENPDSPRDARMAEFHPRGGESLSVEATRPTASAGTTLAFDSVNLDVDYGSRSHTATLVLDYRSTRGAQHVIRLPADADVTRVLIDGAPEPLRADEGALTVPILPGEHSIRVEWRSEGDIGLRTSTPAVDIGAPASNITLQAELPRNRWLLATAGPKLGPAVLYWTELVVLLVFAAILGRTGLAPLETRHWLLLGLGFSTFSWPVFGVVVAWLLACGARERWQPDDLPPLQFNGLQVLLATLSIAALGAIVVALPLGLLGTPDMHVTGHGSFGNLLNWFDDSSQSELPAATAVSVPMWIYKVFILGWALWLSFALLRWLPWVWRCFSSHGYWQPRRAPRG